MPYDDGLIEAGKSLYLSGKIRSILDDKGSEDDVAVAQVYYYSCSYALLLFLLLPLFLTCS